MKKHEEEHVNHERWLITYSDLITLLMIFFIIMYSMGKTDAAKFQSVSNSMGVAMGGGKSMIGSSDLPAIINGQPAIIANVAQQQSEMKQAKQNIDKYIKESGLEGDVATQMDGRGLLIRFKDSILFESGKADIKADFQNKIIKIGKILGKVDSYVRVEGHTDNVPIKNPQFKSNWQLSTTRATNVVELLIASAGVRPNTISAVGYAENRPISVNTTNQGKARNRRVDIILINNKFNTMENNGNK